MAVVLLQTADGRRAMLAFTGLDSLQAWDATARPVPVTLDVAAEFRRRGVARLLLGAAGWQPHGEGLFMARERHLTALRAAARAIEAAVAEQAYELKAENLRIAQAELGRITGEVSADDLLGVIFGSFCIGK